MRSLTIAILLAAAASSAFAQAVSATLYTLVRDSSGAAIAGAKVTVVNQNTNYTRDQLTGNTGECLFASLPLGQYRVSVENAGFDAFSQEGITLQVDQQARLEITLRVGQVSDRVSVTAEAPLVNSLNGEISQVVERRQVEQLPLNGRNFTQLIQLTSGTTTGATGDTQNNLVINQFRGPTNFTANGMRTLYNNFVLDGVDNNESAWNFGGVVILPVVDAIQEFKVATGNFSSEFGRAAGGVVNVQTRAGSNDFHGNLFEFFRNSNLDGNDFFNNASGRARPAFRQNQFGGTFGGPVIRNRVFFFGDYQGARMRRELTFLTSVPTAEARTGDFTNRLFPVIYDPATTRANPAGGGVTRDPFADRRIPASRFDPVSLRFLDFYPIPNTNPGGIALNFLNNPKWSRQGDQGDIRIDASLGNRGTMFGRYSTDSSSQAFPNDLTTAKNPFGGGGRGNNIDLRAQNFAYNLTYLLKPTLVLEGRLGLSRFNFRGLPLGAGDAAASALQVPGVAGGVGVVSATALTIPGLTAFGPTTGVPNFSAQTVFQYVGNVTYTRQRHTVKAGGDFRRLRRNNFLISAQPAGSFNFSPNWTSQTGVGGGQAIASFLLGLPDTITRGQIQGGVGRRNIEFGAYLQDDYKVNSRLSLSYGVRYDLYTPWYEVHDRMSMLDFQTGRVVLASASPFGRGLRQSNPRNFAPRLGLAYRLPDSTRTVLRAGYGISYIEEFGGNGSNPIQNPPNAFTQNVVYSTTAAPQARLRDGVPAAAPLDLRNPSGLYRFIVPYGVPAYAQQWDVSIQRELGRDWLIDASYVGSKGTHLLIGTDPNQPLPGSTAIAQRRPLFSVAPNVTVTVGDSIGNSTYHSGQWKLQKRSSRGYYLLASYTWAKTISDGESDLSNGTPNVGRFGMAQDARNRAAEKSLSDTDVRHRFVTSYGYELPFGKGKQWLNQGAAINRFAGGWQLAGIVTLSTGNPYDIVMNASTANTGTSQRPNRLTSGRLDSPGLASYFNSAAFAAPAAFTWGNSGRNILIGPPLRTFDISAIKDTSFTERVRLQFRTDFFNAFNTPQFNPPNNSIGTPQAGTISSTRFSTNRQIQFVLKMFF
ncbi:MAG: carboxypeptidase regulatory-like domain-containing protein [Bryobacteraceae bacterium]